MNDKIRIQDDLFHFVNQEKLDQLVIPDDQPTAGGFMELHENVEKTLMADFKAFEKAYNIIDPNLKKAVDLYSITKNVRKRNAQGIKPILKDLKNIKSVDSIDLLNRKLKLFATNFYPLPFGFRVDTDMKDSNKHCISMSGPWTILPDTTMYQGPQKDMLLNMWKSFASQVLAFTDLSAEEQALYLEDALAFDAVIATLVKSREAKT